MEKKKDTITHLNPEIYMVRESTVMACENCKYGDCSEVNDLLRSNTIPRQILVTCCCPDKRPYRPIWYTGDNATIHQAAKCSHFKFRSTIKIEIV